MPNHCWCNSVCDCGFDLYCENDTKIIIMITENIILKKFIANRWCDYYFVNDK